jgi:hypothetical protein
MKEEKNPSKSFNSSNLLQSIGLQWWEKPWFYQKPTKIFDDQPLQHKIVRLLNAGPRTDPTDLWQVGPKSVDDGSFFGEIFLKIWLRFENFSLKNNPK